jgi:hypothetical protein
VAREAGAPSVTAGGGAVHEHPRGVPSVARPGVWQDQAGRWQVAGARGPAEAAPGGRSTAHSCRGGHTPAPRVCGGGGLVQHGNTPRTSGWTRAGEPGTSNRTSKQAQAQVIRKRALTVGRLEAAWCHGCSLQVSNCAHRAPVFPPPTSCEFASSAPTTASRPRAAASGPPSRVGVPLTRD